MIGIRDAAIVSGACFDRSYTLYRIESYGPITVGQGAVSAVGTTLRVYVYFVDGALIDTGPARLGNACHAFVASLPQPVQQVALTHLHEDHCGMATYFSEAEIPVYCHREYVATTTDPIGQPLYRRLFWGRPRTFVTVPFEERFTTDRYSFHVIETPGHADEHVVLHETTQGWLFAGDLFVSPRVHTVMRHENLPRLMQSIRRALQLDFETLFCAHAGIVTDGKAALARRLQTLEDIEGRVHELATKGWTVRRVSRQLFPRFHPLTLLSFGEYSPIHVVRSLWPRNS